jgi:hypothetical protein
VGYVSNTPVFFRNCHVEFGNKHVEVENVIHIHFTRLAAPSPEATPSPVVGNAPVAGKALTVNAFVAGKERTRRNARPKPRIVASKFPSVAAIRPHTSWPTAGLMNPLPDDYRELLWHGAAAFSG